ncbi:hypothetical protein KC19_7G170300 [Ceratodon purpureus]|uniref:Uncharacterized protein n=1 Tax=Ceratodon purpureus TaxID=3225 RepID=A0A8T0HBW7_CERPU|nr:hypothetical protein KC19_7G170300 [Ceratodon purpureus]
MLPMYVQATEGAQVSMQTEGKRIDQKKLLGSVCGIH